MLNISTRNELQDFVREVVSTTYDRLLAGEHFDVGQAMLKTYVVEGHPPNDVHLTNREERAGFLRSILAGRSSQLRETEDANLFVFEVRPEDPDKQALDFAVDTQDGRYWQIHTAGPTEQVDRFIDGLVNYQPELDAAWLPGRFLRHFSATGHLFKVRISFDQSRLLSPPPEGRHQFGLLQDEGGSRWFDVADDPDHDHTGEAGQSVSLSLRDHVRLREGVAQLEETDYLGHAMNVTRAEVRYFLGGVVEEFSNARIYNWGKVTGSGRSGMAHLHLMTHLIRTYRQRIERIEKEYAFRTRNGGITAQPITVTYHPVNDLRSMVFNLFSGNQPFRLTGTPRFRSGEVASVRAFDLHGRQPLRFEIGTDYLTVALPEGGCGNTIARLYTNLLEHLDAGARIWGARDDQLF